VAVVTHGLNQAPGALTALIAELNHLGIEVIRLDLRGHGGNHVGHGGAALSRLEALATVTADTWHEEAECAWVEARRRARRHGVPVVFVGVSLGALVLCELLANGPADVSVAAQILFAPALRPRRLVRGVQLFEPWPRYVLSSAAPESYRANPEGTPIAAYTALFELISRLDAGAHHRVNVPTLVLLDEEDELVDGAGLRQMIAEWGLNHWRGASLRKSGAAVGRYHHHLISDAEVVGPATWVLMMARVSEHLDAAIGNP
jgi:alpha-beta hydrolase superfamily lysophospholipase